MTVVFLSSHLHSDGNYLELLYQPGFWFKAPILIYGDKRKASLSENAKVMKSLKLLFAP